MEKIQFVIGLWNAVEANHLEEIADSSVFEAIDLMKTLGIIYRQWEPMVLM